MTTDPQFTAWLNGVAERLRTTEPTCAILCLGHLRPGEPVQAEVVYYHLGEVEAAYLAGIMSDLAATLRGSLATVDSLPKPN